MSTRTRIFPVPRTLRWTLVMGLTLALSSIGAVAEPAGRCRFNSVTLQFHGDASEQAGCLLRRVAKWGRVDGTPTTLPSGIADIVGKPTGPSTAGLRTLLAASAIEETSIGGSLEQGLSHSEGGAPSAPPAKYFVIHDTSSPWLGDAAFPPNAAPALNNLSGYSGTHAVAHVFVNRLGNTLLGHDFAVPWRATKLETQVVGTPAKGLFLHIELLQPRRRDPAGGLKNDALAPTPGFTQAQYDKLALLYAAASHRRGNWLIPAFHAAIDEGLADSHDDPQNFELDRFAAAVAVLRGRLAETTPVTAAMPVLAGDRSPDLATPRAKACATVVAGLASLKPGEPLIAQKSKGQTWKALFDGCDSSDTFAGAPLPIHNGRAMRCSTDPNKVAFLNRYPDGTVVFNAKASVDADGSPVIGGSGWPNNVQTWLTFDNGSKDNFVNAEAVPFIVMPLATPQGGASLMKDTGIGKGDLAVVVKGDRCSFAVVGDAGPWFRLGEASLRSHEDLGNPQCAVGGQTPCSKLKGGSGVGIPSNVTFIVFPGTRPTPLLSQTVNAVVEQAASERVSRFLSINSK